MDDQLRQSIIALDGDFVECGHYLHGSWAVTRDGCEWVLTTWDTSDWGPPLKSEDRYSDGESAARAVAALDPD